MKNISTKMMVAAAVSTYVSLLPMATAQTWQIQAAKSTTLKIVSENTSCNSTIDTAGISSDRTVLLSCQAGVWTKLAGAPVECGSPNAFGFTAQTGVVPNTVVTSNIVTLTGSSCPGAISVTGAISPQCSVNGGSWGACTGYISAGHTIQIRQISSADGLQSNMNLKIAGRTGVFSVSSRSYYWSGFDIYYECVRDADLSYNLNGNGGPYAAGSVCSSSGPGYAFYSLRDSGRDATCVSNNGNGIDDGRNAIVKYLQFCR